jgi:hypothetical protein
MNVYYKSGVPATYFGDSYTCAHLLVLATVSNSSMHGYGSFKNLQVLLK